jgi:hypothetical protein
MLALLLAISAAPVIAGSPSPEAEGTAAQIFLAEEYIQLFVDRERLSIGNALLSQETEILSAAGNADASSRQLTRSLQDLGQANPEMLGHLAQVVQDNLQPLSDQLQGAQIDAEGRIVETESKWRRLHSEVYEQRSREGALRDRRRIATHPATLLSLDSRWFWPVVVIPLFVLVMVVYLDSKHPLHGAFYHGGRSGPWRKVLAGLVAAVAIAAVAVMFLFAEPTYAKLLEIGGGSKPEPREAILRELEALGADIRFLEQSGRRLQDQYNEVQAEWESVIERSFPGEPELVQLERQLRQVRREVAERTALLSSLSEAMLTDLREVSQRNEQIEEHQKAIAGAGRTRRVIRLVIGALVLAAVGYIGVARRSPVPLFQRVVARPAVWFLAIMRRRTAPRSAEFPEESDTDQETEQDFDPESPMVEADDHPSPADSDQERGGTLETSR